MIGASVEDLDIDIAWNIREIPNGSMNIVGYVSATIELDLESRLSTTPKTRVIYTELTVTPGNLLLSKLTFCPVSFVSQKNRGHVRGRKGRGNRKGGFLDGHPEKR